MPERPAGLLRRIPAFCAGCPHGTSTRLPEGSFATAGIGCHFMALDDGDQTRTFTQMGGEGAPFVGMAPFTDTPHMFANIGDGTYTHSGIMAIRQAVAARARITYKLLFNDAVAMTGGQPAEGGFTVPRSPRRSPRRASRGSPWWPTRRIACRRHRRCPPAPRAIPAPNWTRCSASCASYDGVSVLIYDQVCATEKRRRRKRGKMAQPTQSVVINEQVCENCGDCSVQSSCIAIEPVETSLGRKRRINPTSCNVDLSCLKGFCPSFVTVAGPPRAPDADPHWQAREDELAAGAADRRQLPSTAQAVARAVRRHRRRRHHHVRRHPRDGGASGRQGGAHARLHRAGAEERHRRRACADRRGGGGARCRAHSARHRRCDDRRRSGGGGRARRAGAQRAIRGGDRQSRPRRDRCVQARRELLIDAVLHRRTIERATDAAASVYLHAVRLAEQLFGNAQAMNTMLLGLAWQRGLVPVGQAAILRAIELNGAAVDAEPARVPVGSHPRRAAGAGGRDPGAHAGGAARHAGCADRGARAALVAYQSAALAARYRALVNEVVARETQVFGRAGRLSRAAAEGLYRVMAYKDEYEVARLHAAATYGEKPVFHLSPPLITRIDPATGRRRKIALPGWLALPLFRVLRHGRHLRGTALDPFGRQQERRMERALIEQYIGDLRDATRGAAAG